MDQHQQSDGATHPHLPLFLHGWPLQSAESHTRWARVDGALPRDRPGESGATRYRFRPGGAVIALDGAVHGHPLPLRTIWFRGAAGLPVWRHGAPWVHPIHRSRDIPPAESDARRRAYATESHCPRDRTHVVWRPRHDAMVRRCVDERGVCQLHGRQNLTPTVPRYQS